MKYRNGILWQNLKIDKKKIGHIIFKNKLKSNNYII